MSIAVICTQCSTKLNAPDSHAGKRVKCPKCQSVIEVPSSLDEEFAETGEEVEPRPRGRVKADVEVDDDRPRKKKAAASGSNMTRNIIGGVLLAALVAVAAYVFYDRYKKIQDDSAGPASSGSKEQDPPVKILPLIGPPVGAGAGPAPKGGNKKEGVGKKPIGEPGKPITLESPAGFKVTFPGPYIADMVPARMQKEIGLPMTMYVCEDRAASLHHLVGVVEFPAKSSPDERKNTFESVIKALTTGTPKKITPTRRTITFKGKSWEEILVRADEQDGGVLRLLPTDTHVILLGVGQDKGAPDPALVNKFFDSFELTK